MKNLMSALLVFSTGCVYTVVVEHESIPIDEPFDAVVIDNPEGNVSVWGGAEEGLLDVTRRYHNNTLPELDWRVDDGTLFIDGSCPKPHLTCSLDLTLNAPRALDADLQLKTGDLELIGLDGELIGSTTTGSVTLHRLAGSADVETTTGSVIGTDLDVDTLVAHATTGSVSAVLGTQPTLAEAVTQTGSIDLLVPGGRYDVEASTNTGSVEVVGILPDPTADSRIVATTSTGSVRIIGYSGSSEYLPQCRASDGDPHTVLHAGISGDTLTVVDEYSGGCTHHDFELCWPDQSFMESEPVQVQLELLHDAHDDACDAIVTDTRSFDLTPLRQAWVDSYGPGPGSIVVHVDGVSATYTF